MFQRHLRRLPHSRKASWRGFERLESRSMMAVTTSLVGGVLTITGDGDNDTIAILGTANPGELTITGSDNTSVDGTVNGSVTIGGVTSNLIVNLGAGNDNLTLNRVYIAGNIQLDTSDGADTVRLGTTAPVSPTQNLTIDTGAGNDQVFAEQGNVYVGGMHAITAGGDNDSVRIQGASAVGGSDFNGSDGNDTIVVTGYTAGSTGNIRLFGDGGADQLALRMSSTSQNVIVDLGTNPSTAVGAIENAIIDTVYAHTTIRLAGAASGDTSSMTLVHCRTTQVEVIMGTGDNFIKIDANAVNEPPFVLGSSVQLPRLDIVDRTPIGPVTSQVLVQYNLAKNSALLFNEGDDHLALIGNTITDGVRADGRLGANTLLLQGNTFGSSNFVNFTITGS